MVVQSCILYRGCCRKAREKMVKATDGIDPEAIKSIKDSNLTSNLEMV